MSASSNKGSIYMWSRPGVWAVMGHLRLVLMGGKGRVLEQLSGVRPMRSASAAVNRQERWRRCKFGPDAPQLELQRQRAPEEPLTCEAHFAGSASASSMPPWYVFRAHTGAAVLSALDSVVAVARERSADIGALLVHSVPLATGTATRLLAPRRGHRAWSVCASLTSVVSCKPGLHAANGLNATLCCHRSRPAGDGTGAYNEMQSYSTGPALGRQIPSLLTCTEPPSLTCRKADDVTPHRPQPSAASPARRGS